MKKHGILFVIALIVLSGTVLQAQNVRTMLSGGYVLAQNDPNPFNPVTLIKFTLPEDANISMKVYNIMGQEITTLAAGYTRAGEHDVTFDGSGLGTGIYFYRLIANNSLVQTRKMFLVK